MDYSKTINANTPLRHNEGVHKMPNFFKNGSNQDNKDCPKQDNDSLVARMTDVIIAYHKAAKPSTKQAKAAITESITLLEKFISTIKKNVDTTQIISPQHDQLDEQTETLVNSMIQIIQNYYPSDTPSPEQIKTTITQPEHIKSLRQLMGCVLGSIIEQKNQAMAAALREADDDPYCFY